MPRFYSRLNRLEALRLVAPLDAHALCKALFQARVVSSGKRDTWELDELLPETRPADGDIYPVFVCFHGDAEACPHRAWADTSYSRDRHLHALRSFTAEDLGEEGVRADTGDCGASA